MAIGNIPSDILRKQFPQYYKEIKTPEIDTSSTSGIMGLLDKIIERYKPGGEFGKPEEALLGRAKTKSLAETAQGLVSRGLAGTTAGVGAGRLWEEEVGMPARLRLEDIRSQRLVEAMGAKAGYLERGQAQKLQAEQEAERLRQQQLEARKGLSYTRTIDWGRDAGGAEAEAGGGAGGYPSPYEADGAFAGRGPRGGEVEMDFYGFDGVPGSTAEAVGRTSMGMREAQPGMGPQPVTGGAGPAAGKTKTVTVYKAKGRFGGYTQDASRGIPGTGVQKTLTMIDGKWMGSEHGGI